MMKSLALGYFPAGFLSASGVLLLGGNVGGWLLLAWFAGAGLTLLLAAMRFRMPRTRKQVHAGACFLKGSG